MSNEELQKAIDGITKDTSAGVAEPTAPVPTGGVPAGMMPTDTTAADAMPASDAAVAAADDATPIAPPPAAPVVPEMPPMPEVKAPEAAETPEVATPSEAPVEAPAAAEKTETAAPDLGEGVTIGADGLIDVNPVTVAEKVSNIPTEEPPVSLIKVKQDALRELFPLMDKLNIDPVQKFGLYKDIIDLTKEHAAIEQAHEVILEIPDEQTKADALLELLEIIAGFRV